MVLSIDACPAEGPDYPFGWNFEPKWIDFVLRHGAFCLHCRWAQYCGRDRQHDCRRNDDAIADFFLPFSPSLFISITQTLPADLHDDFRMSLQWQDASMFCVSTCRVACSIPNRVCKSCSVWIRK